MLQRYSYLVGVVALIITPLRFLIPWLLLILCGWTIISAIFNAFARAKQMHQIPCTQCRFFTNDYRLKCTVKPCIANTEQAINCSDYLPD